MDEAKKWFEGPYLSRFKGAKLNPALKHERKADWGKAKETQVRGNGTCVVVPVSYANEHKPSFATWDEETRFKQELVEYYAHPIFEVLVIYTNERGETDAYLSQVAYDRYHIVNDRLDLDKFHGWILKANWDDTLIGGSSYEDGKQQMVITPTDSKTRIAECQWYYYAYYTYYGSSCGVNCREITITLHQEYYYSCNEGGPGGSAWEAYPYEVPEGGEGGGGSGPIYVPTTTNYNLRNAICNISSSDRWQMNQNMLDAMGATGLASGILGWNFNKAEAILRSIGASIDDFVPITSTAGKLFGAASGGLGIVKGAIGVFDDGTIDSHEALDLLGGAIGVALAFSPVGWVTVVGGGAVTLAIAIYQNNNEPIVLHDFCN